MDARFWIWLLVIVATLVARAAKKKSPPREDKQIPDPVPGRGTGKSLQSDPGRPMTFEELLDEIQSSKQPKPQPQPVASSSEKYDFEDYSDKIKDKKPLEDTNYDYRKHDIIYDIYDSAKKEAFVRPSLEESMKLSDTVIRFNPFKGYQPVVQRNYAAELAREIGTQAGFRKAFIMSEILQRRF